MTKGKVEIEGVLQEESANSYLINVVTPVELNAKLIKFPILYKDGREFTKIEFRDQNNFVKITTEKWFYEQKLKEYGGVNSGSSTIESKADKSPAIHQPPTYKENLAGKLLSLDPETFKLAKEIFVNSKVKIANMPLIEPIIFNSNIISELNDAQLQYLYSLLHQELENRGIIK